MTFVALVAIYFAIEYGSQDNPRPLVNNLPSQTLSIVSIPVVDVSAAGSALRIAPTVLPYWGVSGAVFTSDSSGLLVRSSIGEGTPLSLLSIATGDVHRLALGREAICAPLAILGPQNAAAATLDRHVCIIDMNEAKVVDRFGPFSDWGPGSIAAFHDSTNIAISGASSGLTVYDRRTKTFSPYGVPFALSSLELSPSDELIGGLSADGQVCIFQTSKPSHLPFVTISHPDPIVAFTFSADATVVFITSKGAVCKFDIDSQLVRPILSISGEIRIASMSRGGSYVAVIMARENVYPDTYLIDLTTRSLKATLAAPRTDGSLGHPSRLSSDGQSFFASKGTSFYFWRIDESSE